MEQKPQEEEQETLTGAQILATLAPYLTQAGIAILAFLMVEVWGDIKAVRDDLDGVKLEQAREFARIGSTLNYLERGQKDLTIHIKEHEKRIDELEKGK